jgi:DNA replication protein DnaC
MIAKEACKQTIRSRYIRVPDLMAEWEDAFGKSQGVKKLLRKYSNYKCLVLDEWLLETPDERQCHFLLELIERRYNESPTVFCTQFHRKDWHGRLGGGVAAEAVMDRIVHNCIWLETGKFNVREYVAKEREALASAMPERKL